jgi:hypothetical protein
MCSVLKFLSPCDSHGMELLNNGEAMRFVDL